MKLSKLMLGLAVLGLTTLGFAESVHQKAAGDRASDKKFLETKEMKGAESGKISRLKGEMPQWGYVSYWMGIATPAGKSIIRFRVYVDGTDVAAYGVYKHSTEGQELIKKLEIPKDAEKDTFVTIDIPVDSKIEWGGVTFKKFEKNDKPGPWIDQVSVVLP